MLIGSALGATLADRLPAQRSLQVFSGLLVVVAVGTATASISALVG